MELLNQVLAATNSWGLEWNMKLNLAKTKSILVIRSQTIAPGYGDLTLGGVEFEEIKTVYSWDDLRL